MADGEQAIELLRGRFSDDIVETGCYREQHWAEIKIDRLEEICFWLRDDPATAFDHLADATAVHWPDDPQPIQMVYHLYSYSRRDYLRLKVRCADHGPLPTLSAVWRSADWNEREIYDMFGIEFEGHPDPRRILMPEDYTDFPLRKEFPLYRG